MCKGFVRVVRSAREFDDHPWYAVEIVMPEQPPKAVGYTQELNRAMTGARDEAARRGLLYVGMLD